MQKKHFFPPFVSVLCFSTGFHPIPREKPGELLEGNFFYSPFFFFIVKQKHQVKEWRVCKSLFWSWSASTAGVPSAWHGVALSSEPAEPFSGATPAINWPDSFAVSMSWSEPERERERRRRRTGQGEREGVSKEHLEV